MYRSALGCVPIRPSQSTPNPKARPRTQPQTPLTESLEKGENETEDNGRLAGSSASIGKEKEEAEEVVEVATPAVSDAEKDIKQLRAALNANIGACYVKQVCFSLEN